MWHFVSIVNGNTNGVTAGWIRNGSENKYLNIKIHSESNRQEFLVLQEAGDLVPLLSLNVKCSNNCEV